MTLVVPSDTSSRPGEAQDVPLRIVMIEDHDMVAAALGGVIEAQPGFELVAIAGTIAQALVVVQQQQPDVIIADLRLPQGEIVAHLPELRRRSPESRILVCTGEANESSLLLAMEAGALGFIVKSQPMAEFIAAIQRVGRGELVVAPELAPALMSRLDRNHSKDRATLSRRELQILALLAAGSSTAAIAEELFLSPNTIRNHVASLMTKLDVHSRLEAVAEATRRGIISARRPA